MQSKGNQQGLNRKRALREGGLRQGSYTVMPQEAVGRQPGDRGSA